MVKKSGGLLIWRIVTITIILIIAVGLIFIFKSPKSKKLKAEANENIFIIQPNLVIKKETVSAEILLDAYEQVYAQSSGLISGVFVKENTWIKPGATIAKLADYRIKENIKSATLELNRIQKLLDEASKLDASQINSLKEKKNQLQKKINEQNSALSKCDIKCEFGGFVTQLNIKSGQDVNSGKLVAIIGRTDPLCVKAELPFELNSQIQLDTTAWVSISKSDSSFTASLISIESGNGRTKIKAKWQKPPAFLNLTYQYKITVSTERKELPIINLNYLVFEDKQAYVYKLDKGIKRKLAVEVSTTDSTNFQLTKPILFEGDTLVHPELTIEN
jgi:biotin carboxyl carrier protein